MYNQLMGVRYSYGDFTTKGHGVIEYADPTPGKEGGKKRKRRTSGKSKFAKRWPSAQPLKHKTPDIRQFSKAYRKKKALEVFRKRHPGKSPAKGQLKAIEEELIAKATASKTKTKSKKLNSSKPANIPSTTDTLAIAKFKKLYPGQQPSKGQIAEIKQEIAIKRKKLGLKD
jgi:hypothetical protein